MRKPKPIFNIKLKEGKQTFTVKEMYQYFKIAHPEEDISFTLFSEIVYRYNKILLEQLLQGKQILLGSGLGKIKIKRVERRFNKKRIDWYETNKLKKQGINKHVYYTDDHWYRFSWFKGIRLVNKTVYKFTPTKGCNGNGKRLAAALRNNEFLHQNFDYDPI